MSEVILIQVSGMDRPGITVALTEVLAQYGIDVLDIGQSVIHDTLSLGLLVEVPGEAHACPVFRDLLFRAHELDLNIRFKPVSDTDYEQWVAEQGRHKHIVTLLGRAIRAEHIARVAGIVATHGLNIDQITRLSGRISRRADADPARQKECIELTLSGTIDALPELRASFLRLAQANDVDIAYQEDDIYRRNRRVVCFDMDSTLIQCEVIDELALEAGVGEQVAAITEAAMRGELDFKESFRRRLALLAGMEEAVLEKVAARLPITEGAERLICNLRRLGYKVAILSGGFTYFAEHLQRRFGVDYVHANQLDFIDGRLSGRIKGEVVDGARKAELLREIAAREGVRLEQVIAVGDGANDLPMLSIAGLGIAFHAKPIVKAQARHSIATVGLDGVLYLLGMRDWEVDKLQGGGKVSADPA